MFSAQLTKHLKYKEKYSKIAVKEIQKKKRNLALDVDIDSRLIRKQYFDVIEKNDISKSFEYFQYHFLNTIHEDKYKHSISRTYNDRLEN